MDLDLFKPEF